MTEICTFLLLIIIGIILISLLRNMKEIPILWIWVIASQAFVQTVSLICINKGMYVSELNENTFNNGSDIVFEIILIFFLTFLLFSFQIHKKKYQEYYTKICAIPLVDENDERQRGKVFIDVLYLLVAYLFVDLIYHGIPLFNRSYGLKLSYFNVVNHFPLISFIYSIVGLYAPGIIGYILLLFWSSKYKREKVKAYFLVFLILSYAYLIGFKVSGINVVIFFAFTPLVIYLLHRKNNKITLNRRKFSILFFIIIAILIFTWGIYFNYRHTLNNAENMDLTQYVFQRTIGLSNHLFWASKNYFVNGSGLNISVYLENLSHEFSAILVHPATTNINYGTARLMSYLGSPSVVNWYLQNNTRMASSFITIFYFNCGPIITVILCCPFAMLFEKIIRMYINSIARKNILEILIATRLLYSYYSFIWNTGSVGDFFNVVNILLFIILILMQSNKPLRIVAFNNQ